MLRLYTTTPIKQEIPHFLSEEQAHYMRNVLRYAADQNIHIFNKNDGEWRAKITTLSKSQACVMPLQQIRTAAREQPVHLLFSPLKHEALLYLIEKATELGVTHLHPLIMDRCNISRLNLEKITKNSLEACQQCERLSPPAITPLQRLREFLQSWDPKIPILWAQERTEVPPLADQLKTYPKGQEMAFLIGPEGGFSPEEGAYLKTISYVHAMHLGPRILRAETAAVVTLSCYQSIVGDWDSFFQSPD